MDFIETQPQITIAENLHLHHARRQILAGLLAVAMVAGGCTSRKEVSPPQSGTNIAEQVVPTIDEIYGAGTDSTSVIGEQVEPVPLAKPIKAKRTASS